jgi:YesN/AraC family two-component response regulator
MKSVLLVDDDSAILEELKNGIAWNTMGYDKVTCLGDGNAAYEFLKENGADLIISDIVMPGMNGLELLRRIKEEKLGNACFVILTVHNSFNYAQQALRLNCREYMLKPADTGLIAETVLRLERDGYIRSASQETGRVLYKKEIDALISAIDIYDENETMSCIDTLCDCMNGLGNDRSIATLNLNYLKVRLIHLPDAEEDADESWTGFETLSEIVLKGNPDREREELKRLALLYMERLSEIRRNASTGILGEIEKEIRADYRENLTLRDLADKYYVNSSYLGRLFKKQFGCSFKEYLCAVRIEEAAAMLRETDDDVSVIAERVGYNNTGYFTQKFMEIKGCTPAKYRNKQHI